MFQERIKEIKIRENKKRRERINKLGIDSV